MRWGGGGGIGLIVVVVVVVVVVVSFRLIFVWVFHVVFYPEQIPVN